MKDYLKAWLCENPDCFILHVKTNDLNSEQSQNIFIAKLIVDLAASLKKRETRWYYFTYYFTH